MIAAPSTRFSAQARPYETADHAGVLEVYRTVFGDHASVELERRWNWSQVTNPYPDQTRRWTLESDRGIVGFLATVPQLYAIGGQRVIAQTPCEFMVEPESRFHGVKLMRAFVAECPDCVTFDDVEATIAVNTWLRIKPVTTFRRYVFAMSPTAAARFTARAMLKAHQAPRAHVLKRWIMGEPATIPSPTYDFAEVGDFDPRFDELAERLAASIPAAVYRDRSFLCWRYRGESPHRSALITTAIGPGGALVGYSVGVIEPFGLRRGVMLDCTVLREHAEAIPGLVHATAGRLRRHGASSMQFYCAGQTASTMGRSLEALGFHCFDTPLQVMVRLANPQLQALALQPDSWHLKLGDTEYSHHAVQLTKEIP